MFVFHQSHERGRCENQILDQFKNLNCFCVRRKLRQMEFEFYCQETRGTLHSHQRLENISDKINTILHITTKAKLRKNKFLEIIFLCFRVDTIFLFFLESTKIKIFNKLKYKIHQYKINNKLIVIIFHNYVYNTIFESLNSILMLIKNNYWVCITLYINHN